MWVSELRSLWARRLVFPALSCGIVDCYFSHQKSIHSQWVTSLGWPYSLVMLTGRFLCILLQGEELLLSAIKKHVSLHHLADVIQKYFETGSLKRCLGILRGRYLCPLKEIKSISVCRF